MENKKLRSAKGEIVDFDLLKIKQQIATVPASSGVAEREQMIDRKLRRKVKKVPTPAPKIKAPEKQQVEEKPVKKQRARIENIDKTIEVEQDEHQTD